MARPAAAYAGGEAAGPAAQMEMAQDARCDVLPAAGRVAVADAPARFVSPMSTVQRWFYIWRDNGLWRSINHALVMLVRELARREASPSACVIDRQSAKTTERGGPLGYDAGKKIKGRKRQTLTDTLGLMIKAVVHTADIQDRDGGPSHLARIRNRFPWLSHVSADGGYGGDQFAGKVAQTGVWSIEIIRQSDTAQSFVVLPRRWVVERTLAWLSRNRRLAKDFERTIESSAAWLFLASVQLLVRQAAKH